MKRNVKVTGMGRCLSSRRYEFTNGTCYRTNQQETQITMAVTAAQRALRDAGAGIRDVDLIVAACAVSAQAIPCTAALIHEELAKGLSIPAMDIGTTCTSFITALDTVSYLVEAGAYRRVLIVSADKASSGLCETNRESYELFSDAAAAAVVEKDPSGESCILYGLQQTFSQGAHDTEIRSGGTLIPPDRYDSHQRESLLFTMNGIRVLKLVGEKLPAFMELFWKNSGMPPERVDRIIPHQASRAVGPIMKRLGIPKEQYVNRVKEYGNMVAASVPYTLCGEYEDRRIARGDHILLMGTAAGLTISGLLLRF